MPMEPNAQDHASILERSIIIIDVFATFFLLSFSKSQFGTMGPDWLNFMFKMVPNGSHVLDHIVRKTVIQCTCTCMYMLGLILHNYVTTEHFIYCTGEVILAATAMGHSVFAALLPSEIASFPGSLPLYIFRHVQ